MILPILKYGAPKLREKSNLIDAFDDELAKIAKSMIETMYASPGIGLAAPQVGINIRLTTIDLSVGEDDSKLIILCNPEILSTEGTQKCEEGCLSIPDFNEAVTRPLKMAVHGYDLRGEEIKIDADGLLARCLSHEIDHLNGILFVDHLSPLKRNLIRNKIKKLAKAGEW
ncbi:MAG: peptide deformylase [Acidobacteria bacterium]|nr:peptide deformylase [Acidobacteriota bacterium]